ncbi:lytic murein transglycosylase B [Rivibacter subsaxonicus]|uniref:Membrane-bound lytic murein transglycosylase B n=1 Tax=Rivibacter subsaxonicus TaxID=457575 RepID=A0A4Q7VNU6_9BURK|nr:lytic murein transglycosylase B [Rivibacter subsaxonicus]RZT98009.1 membrane-bound lytic murein transglycosylase B [Rivibacter subsaxonicus]
MLYFPLRSGASGTRRHAITLALALVAAILALPAPSLAASKKPQRALQSDNAADAVTYGRRDELMNWATEVAERRGLDAVQLQQALAQARLQPAVQRLIAPPPAGSAKNWAAYRARFVEPVRIKAGVEFWRQNEAALAQAQERTGVPASVIVGIIGVETLYARQMGNFRVIDALTTLGFDFPANARRDRSAFFRDELEALFVLAQHQGIDPLSLKGSYAGAIGMPQFMPSSILRYAVDGDADGRIDLHGNPADVIASVAHYLAEFGWQRGMTTHYGVAVPVEVVDRAVLLAPDILPSFSAAQFAERGAVLDAAGLGHVGPLALVELQNGEAAPSYVAGTQNFYAITRYNWSSYYALAVIELGLAVEAVWLKAQGSTGSS